MILEYKFKNYLSFRDNVEFSMLAPKSKVKNRFPNNYSSTDTGVDVLKTAVIVGENAGGKSNFVRSLSYFQSFFLQTDSVKAYRNTINTNNLTAFCPQDNNTLQVFDIEISIRNNGIYQFHLEVDFTGVVQESLKYKRRLNNKYKSILSVTRNDHSIICQSCKDECSARKECHTNVNAGYDIDIPGFESEVKELFKKEIRTAHLGFIQGDEFSNGGKTKNFDEFMLAYNNFKNKKEGIKHVR